MMTEGCGDEGTDKCHASDLEVVINAQKIKTLQNDVHKRLCNAGKEEYCSGIEKLSPDYVTLNIAPPFFSGFGPDFQITRDYYGQWYGAVGIYTGSPGVSLFGGEILKNGRPTPDELEGFITEDSFSMGGGIILGGGGTWGHVAVGDDGITSDDFAVEAGLTSPGGLGSWTYGATMEDISNTVINVLDKVKNFFGF